jgi:hypothetical protein
VAERWSKKSKGRQVPLIGEEALLSFPQSRLTVASAVYETLLPPQFGAESFTLRTGKIES